MSRHTRLETLGTIKQIGLVPLFYHPQADTALDTLRACAQGGAYVIEFTNRGDRALEIFTALAKKRDTELPHVFLGVGSVCNGPTAAMYIHAGADFIVAPLLDSDTAKVCNSHKIPYMPGCGSVTEIHQAHLLGVDICKIFPAGQVGGPAFIKSVLGPCPWAELMPSGGVSPTRENMTSWFDAGACCVGMGSKLISKDLLESKDFSFLTQNIKETLKLIKQIRNQ
jgi:2-dehydro-3-deoxyphosphogluconate aldolase/(4S)-4-hydroxy-2-oxoglutarate aldolase